RQPADLVDLRARPEASAHRRHRPVANDLRPSLAVPVVRAGQLDAEQAREPRLLGHLAEGAVLVGLVAIGLPLGQGPIAVARAVDQEDLCAAVGPGTDHDAPRGTDDLPLAHVAAARPPSTLPAGGARRPRRRGPW